MGNLGSEILATALHSLYTNLNILILQANKGNTTVILDGMIYLAEADHHTHTQSHTVDSRVPVSTLTINKADHQLCDQSTINPLHPTLLLPTIKTSTISSPLLALPKAYPKQTSLYSLSPNLAPPSLYLFPRYTNLTTPATPLSPPMVSLLNVSLPTLMPTSNTLLNLSSPMSRIQTISLT